MAVLPGTAPAPAKAVGVVNRISSKLPEMSGTMAKVAGYVSEHPHAALDASIGDLATRTGTSPATITRFCRMLGYSGYAPFRVAIATELGRASARDTLTTDIGRRFGPDDSPAEVLSTLINAHTRALRDTAAVMDLTLLATVARHIATSRHVDIYGVGGSAMVAEEMHARLYRIGINTHRWSEVHVGLTSAAIQDERCVAIGISNTGRTVETLQMLRQAQQAGALTVALSNELASPLAKSADLAIITSVHEQFLQPDDLSAKHVQLLVLDLLYLLVAQHDFARSTANLAASAQAVSGHRRPRRSRGGPRRSEAEKAAIRPHSEEPTYA
ncbi:MAG TPA: MurR/RpiR family transcriptional regulator [Propionibacteriaceae bacterium]|nr:MurR/RpiR family transcriptional regulator [Propionibacteriaceae bacterium]